MPLPFVEDNSISRRRLEALAVQLNEDDLSKTTSFGWTIAALLAHLAFLDQRVLVLLRRWQTMGFSPSPLEETSINDALKPIAHALPPRAAVDLCINSARAVDAAVSEMSPEFHERIQEQIIATGTWCRFNRSLHRNAHLDHIEAVIKP
jgi:hypothetical protein